MCKSLKKKKGNVRNGKKCIKIKVMERNGIKNTLFVPICLSHLKSQTF